MEKLMGISKKLDTFFKVMQKLVLIGFAVMILVTAILTIVNLVNPDAVIGEDFHIVDIGPITIELAQELALSNSAVLAYVWSVMLIGAVAAVVIYYVFGLVRKILQPMIEGRPFDAGVGAHIKKIGYASLVLGVVQNVGAMLETSMALKAFDLAAFADSGAVRSITANYTLDLSFLIVFFLLLLIAHVFNYGTELQQLSDETI